MRRLGMALRKRVLILFDSYALSGIAVGFEAEIPFLDENLDREKIDDLGETLHYTHSLGAERVLTHLDAMSISLGVKYSRKRGTYGAVNKSTVEYLRKIYRSKAIQIVKGLNSRANKAVRAVIAEGIRNKSSQAEVSRNLAIAFNKLGITGHSKYNVDQIARTQTQIAFNAGKWNIEQLPAVQSVLWGYTYQTVGDDRVRETHAMIQGVTLPKKNKFWDDNYPPNGYNCRCQAIALFEPHEIQKPPKDYPGPDEGFAFNPGKAFSGTE